MPGSKRERPLTVAGPRDLRYRTFMISEALFPGMHVMKPKFELRWIEQEPGLPAGHRWPRIVRECGASR